MKYSEKEFQELTPEELRGEVRRLAALVDDHYFEQGDDRCWADDEKLYKEANGKKCVLKEYTKQDKEILMARCSRYWDTRRYPVNVGKAHEWGSVARQGLYRHFKGGLYLVHGVAVHSETGEHLVVYRPLYGSFQLMVRPETMFIEEVDKPEYNYQGPRFQFVSEMF